MKTPVLFSLVTALVAAPLSSFGQLYSVEVIGPIAGGYTHATALNNNGQLLGHFGGQLEEIYLSSGGVQSFPGDLGGLIPNARGLNDAGDFVGQYFHNGNYHAYSSIGGVVTDLGSLGGIDFSGAADINNAGQIVGQASTAAATTRAIIYSGGVMNPLDTLGGNVSSAAAINSLGDVAGYSSLLGGGNHAFRYTGGSMSDLGTLGGTNSYSTDINSVGHVVGFSEFALGNFTDTHAFIYGGGGITDLGTLGGNSSWAHAVNDAGFIVGASLTGQSVHAFLSNGQTMTDLNSLVDLTKTGLLYLSDATAINSLGQIAGNAINSQGFTVSYVLTPLSGVTAVPEPSTCGLIAALFLVGLATVRRVKTWL